MGASKRKSPGGSTHTNAGGTTAGVTDVQIAFLVECYLKDNSYGRALKEFRTEASAVLAPFKSEAPGSMMSLSDILNDYIMLKERSLVVQQQRSKLDQIFGSIRQIASEYEAATCSSEPSSISGPSRQERIKALPSKRKTSTPSQVAPSIDVKAGASGTKRMRHINPELETQSPVLRGLNPNTPPEKQKRPPAKPKPSTTTPVSSEVQIVGSLEPPKVRSKRQPSAKFQSSKCKSLDFSSRTEPPSPPKVQSFDLGFSTRNEQPVVPRDDLSGDFFNDQQPLSPLDDILTEPLEMDFTEIMRALLDNEEETDTSSPFMDMIDLENEERCLDTRMEKENALPPSKLVVL